MNTAVAAVRRLDSIRSRLRVPVILLALSAFAIAGNAVPPLVTTIGREFGTPFESFGYAFFAQYISFAAASSFIALGITRKYGVGLLAISLGITALLFLTVPLLTGFGALLLWFVPVGLAGGFTETHATIVLGREDVEGSSRLVSLSQAFFCAGAITAPQIVSVMLAKDVPWRTNFYLFAGLVGFVALSCLFVSKRPARFEAHDGGTLDRASRRTVDAVEAPGSRPPLRGTALFVLIALTLAMFFYVVAEGALVAWISTFFEVRYGIEPHIAARTLSAFWLGVLVGRLVMTALPRRHGLWPALLTSTTLGTVMFVFAAAVNTPVLQIIAIAAAGVLLGPVWPVLVSVGRSLLRSERAVAVIVTGGAVGVAVGPFAASRFMVLFGIERLFLFVIVCSLLVTLIVYTVRARHIPGRAAV